MSNLDIKSTILDFDRHGILQPSDDDVIATKPVVHQWLLTGPSMAIDLLWLMDTPINKS